MRSYQEDHLQEQQQVYRSKDAFLMTRVRKFKMHFILFPEESSKVCWSEDRLDVCKDFWTRWPPLAVELSLERLSLTFCGKLSEDMLQEHQQVSWKILHLRSDNTCWLLWRQKALRVDLGILRILRMTIILSKMTTISRGRLHPGSKDALSWLISRKVLKVKSGRPRDEVLSTTHIKMLETSVKLVLWHQ